MYKDNAGITINSGDQFIYDDDTLDRVYICILDKGIVRCSDLDDPDQTWTFPKEYLAGCPDKLSRLLTDDQ